MFNPTRPQPSFVLILGTLLLLSSLAAAAAAEPGRAPTVRSEMLVTTDWLAQHLEDPKVVILHIADDPAHYDAGHIPGARFVAWKELATTRDDIPNNLPPVSDLQKLFERLGVGEEARLVLYGDKSGVAAARGFFTLDYLGHGRRTALLDGGLEKWRTEKRPVSTESPTVAHAPFTPRVRPEIVITMDGVREVSAETVQTDKAGITLIDARPPDEYAGDTKGVGVSRGGHIPGAASLFWMQHVESKENPVLRSEAELRRLYEAVGAAPDTKVVTYCRTGGQASHTYFIARYLGYDVAMYDGSFFEWSNAPDTPVITGTQRK
jgi:thiosulfate/3-mercaptopyruvate sulfurtransferase